MPGNQTESDLCALEPAGADDDMLRDLEAKPVAQHLLILAAQVQIGMEQQVRRVKAATDLPKSRLKLPQL